MTGPLLSFAQRVAASRPDGRIIVAGASEQEVPTDVIHLSDHVASLLLRKMQSGIPASEALSEAVPTDTAIDSAVLVLLPGRTPHWNTHTALEFLKHVEGLVGTAVLAAPISANVPTAESLAAQSRSLGIEPTFIGLITSEDPLAPGSPALIVDSTPQASPTPNVIAFVRNHQADGTTTAAIKRYAEEGISVVVIDAVQAPMELVTEWQEKGALGAARCANTSELRQAVTTFMSRFPADWYLAHEASQRIVGPWAGVGLRSTLARFQAAGWTGARRTVLHVAPEQPIAPGADPYQTVSHWTFGVRPSEMFGAIAIHSDAALSRINGEPTLTWDVESLRLTPFNLLCVELRDSSAIHAETDTPRWYPWPGQPDIEHYLLEHLSGFGAFARAYPAPPNITWWAEERLKSWSGFSLRVAIGRAPRPDPLSPVFGQCLVRWDLPEHRKAELWLTSGGGPEEFAGRGAKGTIAVDRMWPNVRHTARLYGDTAKSVLIGELEFGYSSDLES